MFSLRRLLRVASNSRVIEYINHMLAPLNVGKELNTQPKNPKDEQQKDLVLHSGRRHDQNYESLKEARGIVINAGQEEK
ncbi:hypothetical protein E4T56_gene12092 [Termitomyces sp. T112]|nr:hypothetical protein E4T56_gene12092 [Termitomyces sp. T112]KAH0578163.1 hypothetical protein H2248_004125 [Termitomyces sp. 'cryptogamus']